jgi:hypothetical protein
MKKHPFEFKKMWEYVLKRGLVNVPIEKKTNIGDIIFNRYLKVMFKIPKMGHLPSPVKIVDFPFNHACLLSPFGRGSLKYLWPMWIHTYGMAS